MTWRWPAWLGLAAVTALFCAPLFIGLDRQDQRSDEAIYSYAVNRVLETGDWLTPRSIPSDGPFLEKPPLKIWLVAGAMSLGLLPVDDGGMRALDALFCSAAFLYVFLLGRRMDGPLAGAIAVFLLFSYDPLIFEHGVRGNNMEGVLMLAYCGGVYHFVRWAEDRTGSARRHAYAATLLFVAAFMSKFVAAFFLPIVWAGAIAIRPARWQAWRSRWREWLGPAIVALCLSAPWFVYQTVQVGRQFWFEIVGVHVYQRFFGTLMPTHLEPWHHYFTKTWLELGYAGLQIASASGAAVLVWRAWRQRDWLARLALIWWLGPFVLMSLGTSKLFYYGYPFLPPLALGGGFAVAGIVRLLRGPALPGLLRGTRFALPAPDALPPLTRRRALLLAGGAVCFALAAGTAMAGPITLEVDGMRLFRNSSVPRVVFIGAVLWYAAGRHHAALTALGVGALLLVLPVSGYAHRVQRFSQVNHPLRTARDCALAVQGSGPRLGVLFVSGDLHHAYFYYLHRLGPWVDAATAPAGELARRLEQPGAHTPVIVSMEDYQGLGGGAAGLPPAGAGLSPAALEARLSGPLPEGFAIGDVVILLPGPYETCARPASRAGARELPTPASTPSPAAAAPAGAS